MWLRDFGYHDILICASTGYLVHSSFVLYLWRVLEFSSRARCVLPRAENQKIPLLLPSPVRTHEHCSGFSVLLWVIICTWLCVCIFVSLFPFSCKKKTFISVANLIVESYMKSKYLSSYSLGFLWLEMFATIVSLWLCDAMPLITVSLFFWFLEFNFLLVHVMVVVTRHDSCGHKREQRFLQGTSRHHLHRNNNQP